MGHIHFWGKHNHAYRVVIHESYIPTEGKKEKDTFDTVTRSVLNEYYKARNTKPADQRPKPKTKSED